MQKKKKIITIQNENEWPLSIKNIFTLMMPFCLSGNHHRSLGITFLDVWIQAKSQNKMHK